jgi:membrane-associated PAP2 superfamily phosphatase
LAIVPASIAVLKSRSDIYTPHSLVRYQGEKPYHHLFEPLPPGWPPNQGHAFPAGHASGGFALMSLLHLFRKRRQRWAGLGVGLVCGWTMGVYQMVKGAHFLSHTVVTMLIAWLLIELLAMLLKARTASQAGWE